MKRRDDPIASLLADGEAPPDLAGRAADPRVAAEVAEIRRLSRRLQVPPDVARPDPFFVARFRARRAALRQAAQSALAWRRAALRLLPFAISALAGAAIAVWPSAEPTSALGELEMRELGRGVADVTIDTAEVEPVLRIALGEL